MCFSATASFIAAGATGIIGLATLTRVSSPRDLPLAVMPLVFSAQQAVEGALWLILPVAPKGPVASALITSFLMIAHVLWPLFVPLSVMRAEPQGWRHGAMRVCMALGAAVAAYMAWVILSETHGAFIDSGHIYYALEYQHHDFVGLAYLLATGGALVLSTRPMIIVTGALVLVGYVVSWFFYWHEFLSVWCFFAALASMMLLFHFHQPHRRASQAA